MNKDNKHPLSPEELFKRLGDQQAGSNEPLDDFEKEALEGFAMLGDEQQARDSYQEVLTRLSKKNGEQKKPERKTRIVWLSAAAILVIILIVGVVWLNDQKDAIHENLAMNKQDVPTEKPVESQPLPAVETEAPVNEPARVTAVTKEAALSESSITQEATKTVTDQAPVYEFKAEDKEQQDRKSREITASGENGNYDRVASGKTNSNTYGWTTATDTKGDVTKEEKPADNLGREQAEQPLAKNTEKADKHKYKDADAEKDQRNVNDETVTGTYSNSTGVVAASPDLFEKQQETVVTKNEGKKRAEKEPGYSAGAPAENNRQKVMLEDAVVQNKIADYYSPGEQALKDHLIAKAGSKTLSGSYTVKASVAADGKLKVSSVIITGGNCSDCAKTIKKILDGMSGWRPSPGLVFNLTF